MSRGVALVTGAGTGIGRSVAVALARADYAMVLAGRRKAQLEQTAVEAGGATLALVADVTQPGSVEALFAEIKSRFGRLDLLFNNAGIATAPVGIDELSVEDWRATIDTNLTGTFLCTRAAFRLMKSQQPPGGRIINNGSLSATTPRPEMIAYTASKHGVSGLTKATALEGRQYHIACGQIDIGNARTPLSTPILQGALQADGSRSAEPTLDVAHVADAVLYMAGLPLDANVLFMTVMANQMPYVGRG
ncbi:MAG TPA: SDR family oxidoreductase [Steroidobacteraceae bacterium]|jgi:NAD(P)-dependent dehydrogenase (short-subunit alcohol dehydrogenase family)|nr:SDR family oxidoreductase [Steroidobacteraceae bacterium]